MTCADYNPKFASWACRHFWERIQSLMNNLNMLESSNYERGTDHEISAVNTEISKIIDPYKCPGLYPRPSLRQRSTPLVPKGYVPRIHALGALEVRALSVGDGQHHGQQGVLGQVNHFGHLGLPGG